MAINDIYEQNPSKYMDGSIKDVLAIPRAAAGYVGNKFHGAFGVDDPYKTNPYIENIKTGLGSPEGSIRVGVGTKGVSPFGVGDSSGVAPFISFGNGAKLKTEYRPQTTSNQVIPSAIQTINKRPQSITSKHKVTSKAIPNVNTTSNKDSLYAEDFDRSGLSGKPQELPALNYGEIPDGTGGFTRVYTPSSNVAAGQYDNINVLPFVHNVSQGSIPYNQPALGSVVKDMSPGSQGAWEANQANVDTLNSYMNNVPNDIKGTPFAYGAAMNQMKQADERDYRQGTLGVQQGELALKREDAPYERGYKTALSGGINSETNKRNTMLPLDIERAITDIYNVKSNTNRTAGVERREQEIFPLTKKELEAKIGREVSETEWRRADTGIKRARALIEAKGGRYAGDTGLVKQNEVAGKWFDRAEIARAQNNTQRADYYESLALNAMKAPSEHFSNKGSALGDRGEE